MPITSNYKIFPQLSPYTNKTRYEHPKEIFKQIVKKIYLSGIDKNCNYNVVDIGCANGEFLYYLKKNFPNWNLTGYDFTEEFIATGNSFSGLKDVNLKVADLFELKEYNKYDMVFCMGTFQIFKEASKPLDKLIKLCKDNGMLFIEGMFNQYNVDVIVEFCDNSKSELEGIWRSDFNQHSYYQIKKCLDKRRDIKKYELEELEVNVEIPYNPNNPSTYAWSFRDEEGNNILIDGKKMIRNSTLLTIKKNSLQN